MILPYLLLLVLTAALPITSNDEPDDTKLVVVNDYDELYANYSRQLQNPSLNTVFRIKQTNTFLSLSNDSLPVDLDKFSAQGWLRNLLSRKNHQWVEFAYNDTETVEYPGYIPASSCQSHEYGDGGSIGFSYSYGQDDKLGSNWGINWVIGDLTLSAAAGSALGTTTSISGTVSCNIGKGKVGQVLIRPSFVRSQPRSRRVQYSQAIRKFVFEGEFEQREQIQRLLLLGVYRIACATNDKVSLFCDTRRFEVSWDSPLGAEYVT